MGFASVAALQAYDATMAARNRDSASVRELEALVASLPSGPPPPPPPPPRKVQLASSDLAQLSLAELKELITLGSLSHEGILEKSELLKRARQAKEIILGLRVAPAPAAEPSSSDGVEFSHERSRDERDAEARASAIDLEAPSPQPPLQGSSANNSNKRPAAASSAEGAKRPCAGDTMSQAWDLDED